MAFPKLTATEEMKQIAASDMPRKEKTKYGYVTEVCDYYVYLRCVVQAGILKAALFFPDYLRLDGNNPVYEVYLDKENRQFTTYDCLNQKWSEAKLDRLDWKHWYAKSSWVSEEEAAVIQTYLDNDKRGASAILQFQRAVRDEQLVQRHRLETDPWDKDLEQVPELPKDWNRWVNKVAIQQNYIYYHYKKGGAKTGYCTYCEKEVPIKGHPHHNQEGYCSCCRHPVVFKAYDGQTWTFDYFMQQVMISNCTLFFPIIITLIAGYIITREYTDDTMKNISTIPIPYKQLLSGKLLVLLLLTICFSLIGCVLALVINVIAGFPGVHFGNLLNMFIRVTGANIGIYISVLPIILLFCCSANNFLGGVALAFVYGYFGTFEGTLLNYYPIKASMILVDPTCGAEYGYTYHIFPAFIIMVLTFLISVIILANKKKDARILTVAKKKKIVRKKGW